ncbi:MAG TPA: hypothetical protein VHV56_05000 [Pseudolabrys sp.]|jgi:hypothetical protein|nr:hypothetical protein [Pseudolabrys sp.]
MTHTRLLLIVAALAAATLVGIAFLTPRIAAGGWLLAFSYVAAFPLGSLALLLIHRLTGGRWGHALEPFLRPVALTTPLLLLLVIPVLGASPILFPWAHGQGDAITHSVRLIYLNIPAYVIRSLVALGALSVLAIILPGSGSASAPLIAGAGLVFYGIAITFMGLDWILTPEAPFFSTSFGASVAFTQLLSALALVAVCAPREPDPPDLGALMLVITLAITYADFMAVLVMWYGDVPSRVFWFVERLREPWLALAVAAFIFASLIPIIVLMFARMRANRSALRLVGASSFVGLAVYQSWLLAPAFGVAAAGIALLAALAMAAFIAAAVAGDWMQRLLNRARIAHG